MMNMIRGLVAATPTPMRPKGGLNLRVIEKLAGMLANNAVNTVFVCGTAGEFPSLTVSERMSVARQWTKVADTSLRVVVHVGHTCIDACRTMAADAQKNGAHAIAAVPPYYFKPTSVDDLIEFCALIAAAAPKLPFYYYHMPELTGVKAPMVKFLQEAPSKIPTLAGVKFTSENLTDFGRCVDAHGKNFNLLLGRDDLMLAGLKVGAHGAVGTTYNFAAQLYMKIIRAFKSGDMGTAQNFQVQAVEMLAAMRRFGSIAAAKYAMKEVGIDCGPVRPPLHKMTAEQEEQLHAAFDRLGFSEYCNKH